MDQLVGANMLCFLGGDLNATSQLSLSNMFAIQLYLDTTRTISGGYMLASQKRLPYCQLV